VEVTVNLKARNALTWVANVAGINGNQPDAINTAPLELGYRVQELVANPSLHPSLSDVHFQLSWQEQAGADLPDLARLHDHWLPGAGISPFRERSPTVLPYPP
jgi:hypothetical protein